MPRRKASPVSDTDTGQGPTLTHSQSINRLKEITSELERLQELDGALSPEDETYFETLTTEFTKVDEHRKKMERDAALAKVRSAGAGLNGSNLRLTPGSPRSTRDDYDRDSILEPDSVEDHRFRNPWDLSEVRTFGRDPGEVNAELRSRALAAIEKMPVASDNVRAAATKIVEQFDDKDSRIARLALLTSSPVYLRAWSKMARSEQHLLSAEESNSLSAVRAMSLTDAAGGYLVPFQLDPTVIITSAGSRNDIRNAARQVVATGDVWNGVTSGAVSWGWAAEAAPATDNSTTFTQPTIPIFKAQGFVPISIEALADEQNVAQEVAKLLAFGKDQLEATAFITGNGTTAPKGLITALTGTASEINAAADDTFAIGDVYTIEGALPARYRGDSSWLANNSIYNLIRRFDTSGGGGFWANLNDGRPPQLLGRSALEAEAMDGTVTTSGAVSNFILAYGDFSNYVIADRIGMTVEFIPHLFRQQTAGAGFGLPTGQRGWYAYYRTGADVVSVDAFRLLDVPSIA